MGGNSVLITVPAYTMLDSSANTVITVTTVPEPVECAAAAGLGLLGFAVYRLLRTGRRDDGSATLA